MLGLVLCLHSWGSDLNVWYKYHVHMRPQCASQEHALQLWGQSQQHSIS